MAAGTQAPTGAPSHGIADPDIVAEIYGDVPDTGVSSVVTLRDVGVSFGGLLALEGIDLEIVSGELVAIVGANGAGKTTLLNAICGLVKSHTHGELDVLGHDVRSLSSTALAQAGVGRSFQAPRLIEEDTVLECLLAGAHFPLGYRLFEQVARPWRIARAERAMVARAEALLTFVGLADVRMTPVSELSYGTRKLVDIARAIMPTPSLLLLDEPSSGLDESEQATVGAILRAIGSAGRLTVVIVEHHMDVVRAAATRVVNLHAARILIDGTPDEVFGSDEYRSVATGGDGQVPAAGRDDDTEDEKD